MIQSEKSPAGPCIASAESRVLRAPAAGQPTPCGRADPCAGGRVAQPQESASRITNRVAILLNTVLYILVCTSTYKDVPYKDADPTRDVCLCRENFFETSCTCTPCGRLFPDVSGSVTEHRWAVESRRGENDSTLDNTTTSPIDV